MIAGVIVARLIIGLSFAVPITLGTTTGFLAAPTDQIEVPGKLAGGEITPEGNLYTGWAEYRLRFGRRLWPWNQPTRSLPDPSIPILVSTLSEGQVRYTLTVFAVEIDRRPVAFERVTIANLSNRPQLGQVAMAVAYTHGPQTHGVHGIATSAYRYERPVIGQPAGFYAQPGVSFSSDFSYAATGRDLVRSGLLLARGPEAHSRPLGSPPSGRPTASHDARAYSAMLRQHGQVTFTWQIPLEAFPRSVLADRALDVVSWARACTELEAAWRREEHGAMAISVPEPKVTATYRAALVEILSSRYQGPTGWVQASNKLQYQAFWIRDAAFEIDALDLAGLHRQAAQDLTFLDTFQQPNGLFISRPDQYDGWGQALWALSTHAELTQEPAYAAEQLARMEAAIAWLEFVTTSDPLGLLPAGEPGDDEFSYGHITGDNVWAAAGLRSAIAAALTAGRQDLALEWTQVAERFDAALGAAVTQAAARFGYIPPVLDAAGGRDWGNYFAAYPVEVFGARSHLVAETMAWAHHHMSQGLPTYDGWSLHDYLGFSIFQTDLAAGEPCQAVAGLYAELAHTTSTDNGWEWDIAPFGFRGSTSDLAPHGTFAADYIALLRTLLVAEPSSGGVNLLAGASPAWLTAGERIRVSQAPTRSGSVSFEERATTHGEELAWRTNLARGTRLTWTLPTWARQPRRGGQPIAGHTLVLAASSGSVAVTFQGSPPKQSYTATVAALNAEYRTHHQAPPLVAARH